MTLDVGDGAVRRARGLRRAHASSQVASDKSLAFERRASTPTLPRAIVTDAKRLQQMLKNLLSNAFKFTEQRRRGR